MIIQRTKLLFAFGLLTSLLTISFGFPSSESGINGLKFCNNDVIEILKRICVYSSNFLQNQDQLKSDSHKCCVDGCNLSDVIGYC